MSSEDQMSVAQSYGGYSTTAENKTREFVGSKLDADILTVPGVGAKGAEALEKQGIKSSYQLIGQYFLLDCDDEGFREWLNEDCGIQKGHVHTIWSAIHQKCYGL
eukprot:TRINITY_DN1905_c0_g1_i1.p2 TRINITY_DN1905_c0_g1~~TRINITY_DN1905_c0_g1_i1.p2  ORF type:complete len:105 (+),score=35.82 TRINITY_DN1905_c0_g1_i1:7-321(+)